MSDSGQKTVSTNTRERAVSNDLNRAQSFGAQAMAELLRYLLNVQSGPTDDLDASAQTIEYLVQGNPLRAEVINGFLVRPQVGSLILAIDGGLLFCIDPPSSPNPDDSPYKFVSDAGSTVFAALSMTANSSGLTRIDVIECQRQVVVAESDNRDLFNPISGLFSTSTVTKATKSSLVYRVRPGAPGAGFPGTVQGWLPLAVASVPDGATTNDTITFWDVRPMLSDRASLQNTTLAAARRVLSRIDAVGNIHAAGGLVEWVLGNRRLGGRLRRGTPGTDANSIDLDNVVNFSTDMAGSPVNALAYLYLCTPFGLPRWARYTDATTGSRVPRSPRGIPVMSPAKPNESGIGAPLIPASLGFGTGTTPGVAIATTTWDGSHVVDFADGGTSQAALNGTVSRTAVITPPNIADTTFTAGVDYPPHAREVCVSLDLQMPIAAAPFTVTVFVRAMSRGVVAFQYADSLAIVPAAGALNFGRTYWLPIEPSYPADPTTFDLQVLVEDLADTVTSVTANIIGWRL